MSGAGVPAPPSTPPRGLAALATPRTDESSEVVQMPIGEDSTGPWETWMCIGLCCGSCSIRRTCALCSSVSRCLSCELRTQCCSETPCSPPSLCCCAVGEQPDSPKLGFSCGCFSCNCCAEPGATRATCCHRLDSATFNCWGESGDIDSVVGCVDGTRIGGPPDCAQSAQSLSLTLSRPRRWCAQGPGRWAVLLSALPVSLLHERLFTPCTRCQQQVQMLCEEGRGRERRGRFPRGIGKRRAGLARH